jgi:hypothetical protein
MSDVTRYFRFNRPEWFSVSDADSTWSSREDGGISVTPPPPPGEPYLGVIPAGAVLEVDESDPGAPGHVNLRIPGHSDPLPWPSDIAEVGEFVSGPGYPFTIEILDYPTGVQRFPDTRWASQEDLDRMVDEDFGESW